MATASVLLKISSYISKTCCACPLRKNRSESNDNWAKVNCLAKQASVRRRTAADCELYAVEGAENGGPDSSAACTSIGHSVVG